MKAIRFVTYADESPDTLYMSYSRCEIEEEDDFADGKYELTFQGQTVMLLSARGMMACASETRRSCHHCRSRRHIAAKT